MKRPVWAIVIGILMLLFGGCGACNRATEIMLPDLNKIMEESMVVDYDTNIEKSPEAQSDTLSSSNGQKLEDLSEEDRKVLDLISDTILLDENENIDIESTILKTSYISDYRQKWIVRFGYIGLFIAIFFIIAGIMLIGFKKYTIPIVITGIALSMVSNIVQLVIYSADKESGALIGSLGNVGFYVSLAIDILLLILVLVLDKSFFQPQVVQEDYYD